MMVYIKYIHKCNTFEQSILGYNFRTIVIFFHFHKPSSRHSRDITQRQKTDRSPLKYFSKLEFMQDDPFRPTQELFRISEYALCKLYKYDIFFSIVSKKKS